MRCQESAVERLLCNNKRMLAATDWSPHVTPEQGLIQTIAWIRAHRKFYEAEIHNV